MPEPAANDLIKVCFVCSIDFIPLQQLQGFLDRCAPRAPGAPGCRVSGLLATECRAAGWLPGGTAIGSPNFSRNCQCFDECRRYCLPQCDRLAYMVTFDLVTTVSSWFLQQLCLITAMVWKRRYFYTGLLIYRPNFVTMPLVEVVARMADSRLSCSRLDGFVGLRLSPDWKCID